MNTYFETGLSENYLPNWGVVEAVREFVQNAIYAHTVLGDTMHINWEDGKAIICNKPSGFNKGKLLIGESDQRGVQGSPGEYGEGMNVGMSVLLRQNRHIDIETNGFNIYPSLKPCSLNEEVRVLGFGLEDTGKEEGTKVSIECTEEELFEATKYFAVLEGVEQELLSKDSIIELEEGHQNCVYVNGVKICDVNSIFSYNFVNPSLMNRDRTTVDTSRLHTHVAGVLAQIGDTYRAKKVLSGILHEDTCLEAQSSIDWGYDREIWREAITGLYGDKVAIATGTDSDTQARYRRFTLIPSVPNRWGSFFEYGLDIKRSNQLAEIHQASNIHRKPTGDNSSNLGWCKRLIKLYVGDYGTVRVSETLKDAYGNECNGLYDSNKDIIWLRAGLLSSKKDTFKVLLHETVHRITGAMDNTEGFTKGFEEACWNILMKGKDN